VPRTEAATTSRSVSGAQPPARETQRLERKFIGPLRVVDHHYLRAVDGQLCKHGQQPRARGQRTRIAFLQDACELLARGSGHRQRYLHEHATRQRRLVGIAARPGGPGRQSRQTAPDQRGLADALRSRNQRDTATAARALELLMQSV
jgi:hypothetical protein